MKPWTSFPFLTALLRGSVLGSLAFTCAVPSASAQLNARPAAVQLVATLEILSLAIAPSREAPQNSSVSPFRVDITTSWAIPAHLTTLRLIALHAGPSANAAETTLWTKPAGLTNRADSFVQSLVFRENSFSDTPARQPSFATQNVTLQIEAL